MSPQCAAIVADLERFKSLFDFTQRDLANQCAETIAAGIFEYMDAQVGPDNAPWIALSEKYVEWKAKAAPGEPMAVLYRLMKDPTQLYGTLATTAHRLVQTYGTSEEAQQQACWFQEGNDHQPARPFYALNDLVLITLATILDAHFSSFF